MCERHLVCDCELEIWTSHLYIDTLGCVAARHDFVSWNWEQKGWFVVECQNEKENIAQALSVTNKMDLSRTSEAWWWWGYLGPVTRRCRHTPAGSSALSQSGSWSGSCASWPRCSLSWAPRPASGPTSATPWSPPARAASLQPPPAGTAPPPATWTVDSGDVEAQCKQIHSWCLTDFNHAQHIR